MSNKGLFSRGLMSGLIMLGYVMTINVCYAFQSYYVAFQSATGFTGAQMGLLITAIGSMSIILYFPAGIVADRLKTKTLLVTGMVLAGICSAVIATLPEFNVMLILYIAMGIFSTGIIQLPAMKSARLLGSDEEQKTIASYNEVISKGIGLIVSMVGVALISSKAGERFGMQMVLYTYAGIILVIAVVVAIFFKPVVEDTAQSDPIKLRDIGSALKYKGLWFAGLVGFGIYTASTALIYLQPYLVETFGVSIGASSTLGVLYKQLGIIAAPVFSWILSKSKKIKYTPQLIAIGLGLTLLCFVYFIFVPSGLTAAVVVFVLASFLVMGVWAIGYVMIPELGIPVRLTGIAFSIYNILMYLGDLFLFTMFGGWTDAGTDGYSKVFTFTAVVLVVCVAACLVLIKEVKKAYDQGLVNQGW